MPGVHTSSLTSLNIKDIFEKYLRRDCGIKNEKNYNKKSKWNELFILDAANIIPFH